ncbi:MULTISPECIES: MCP four helix bundle domain-containing protein [unclassified Carboxylicivirga]|uniref:MCP four helix bundle domain-containing protein n=1 Tax=Carboxylicivirga TaxID=1628153 RepID=UPI003D3589FB
MDNNTGKPTSNKLIYIIGGIALAIIAILLFLFLSNRQEYKAVVEEMTEEKLLLTEEFQSLATDYDSLHSNNDTLNLMLEQEREKITHLIEEIKTIKATNAHKIREYKKELSTLRGVMKNFVVQIDSLNRRNEELVQENIQYRKEHQKITESYKELEQKKKKLDKKVEIASQLETRNIEVSGLNARGNDTKKARNVSKIRVCCTVEKNITAQVGMKSIYIRILRPDEALLLTSLDNVFEYEDEEINYSAKREFEYGGEDVDVCIYYPAADGELLKGIYTVDIFVDGFNIGTNTFELK